MSSTTEQAPARLTMRKLPRAARRGQLIETALAIVREDGADRLTLGRLAIKAGVSKPVVYDHFETRSALLIELYRWIDRERVNAFRDAWSEGAHGREETVRALAAAYVACAADTTHEFHMIGAALAGSEEKATVFQELLDECVAMFVTVLAPHSALPTDELERRCVGLVGAGEALAAALIRGRCSERQAVDALGSLIRSGLGTLRA